MSPQVGLAVHWEAGLTQIDASWRETVRFCDAEKERLQREKWKCKNRKERQSLQRYIIKRTWKREIFERNGMSRRQAHFWVYIVASYSLQLAPLQTNPVNSKEFQQTKFWHAILLEAHKTVNWKKLLIENEISFTFLRFYRNSNPIYSFWLFFRLYVEFGPIPLKAKNKRNTPERKKRREVLFLGIYWSSKEWYECDSFYS